MTGPAARTAVEPPRVTAAVLAFNRRDALRATLNKLGSQLDWPVDQFEVVVVDNASTDGTAEMVQAEFPHVRLILNERNTGIAGWNRAFEVGTGDWFLVLDDDCYVEDDALRRAVEAAQAEQADLVSFRVVSSEAGTFNEFYDTGLLAFWGCSALISRRAVRELGGFDPGIFIWGHEAEFVARLLDRGMRRLHLPEVTAVHMKPLGHFKLAQHKRNLESFGYIAGKLLVQRDLVPVVANLVLRVITEAGRRPRILTCLPALLRGVRDGRRNRAPVRAEVSALYRHNFIEFGSPLAFVRGPVLRWRQRGQPALAERDAAERRDRFWRQRVAYYPQGKGTLSVQRET